MNNDADNIELQEAGEKNPMHSESGKDAGPSSAYTRISSEDARE